MTTGFIIGAGSEDTLENKITNCLLEVPQRIKYTLENGTLTIKAGSIVIVPYGVEDLTAQHQKGSTFLHDNFRVYNTQFEDGKFFVWAEVQNDIYLNYATTDTTTCSICIRLLTNNYSGSSSTYSGNDFGNLSGQYYNTETNIISYLSNGTIKDGQTNMSLPIMRVIGDGTQQFGTINQIFNGMGYIGSTVWVDKGVKCLIPNGRNEDGTLNNIEYTFTKAKILTLSHNYAGTFWFGIHETGAVFYHNNSTMYLKYYADLPTPATGKWFYAYVEETNKFYQSINGQVYEEGSLATVGSFTTNASNVITDFRPDNTNSILKSSDARYISGWGMPSNKYIDLTLGARGTVYTAPANGWFSCNCQCTQDNLSDTMYFALNNNSNETGDMRWFTNTTNLEYKGMIPCKKGDHIAIVYSAKGVFIDTWEKGLRFYYAEGEQ